MALRTIIAALALAASLGLAQAAETVHRLAVHVNEADPAVMSLALNNIDNVRGEAGSIWAAAQWQDPLF